LHAALLESTLISHADLEDALLRPEIQPYVPLTPGPTDHEQIRAGLKRVGAAVSGDEARRCLLGILAQTRAHFWKEESIAFVFARRRCLWSCSRNSPRNRRASGEYRLVEAAVCGATRMDRSAGDRNEGDAQ